MTKDEVAIERTQSITSYNQGPSISSSTSSHQDDGSPRKGVHPHLERSRSLDHSTTHTSSSSSTTTAKDTLGGSTSAHLEQSRGSSKYHRKEAASSSSSSAAAAASNLPPTPPPPRDIRQELSRKYSDLAPEVHQTAASSSSSSSRAHKAPSLAGVSLPPQPPGRDYVVVFQDGPMGFTLTKVEGGRALVTKVSRRYSSHVCILRLSMHSMKALISCMFSLYLPTYLSTYLPTDRSSRSSRARRCSCG